MTQLLHTGTAITYRDSYYIQGQLLHTGTATTYRDSYYIQGQLLHTGTAHYIQGQLLHTDCKCKDSPSRDGMLVILMDAYRLGARGGGGGHPGIHPQIFKKKHTLVVVNWHYYLASERASISSVQWKYAIYTVLPDYRGHFLISLVVLLLDTPNLIHTLLSNLYAGSSWQHKKNPSTRLSRTPSP